MAQPDLIPFRRRGLAIALRTDAATPVVPSPTANGVILFDGSSGTEFDRVDRPVDRPFFSGEPFAVAARRAYIEGDFELYPPATPGEEDADCHVLLLPAGMTSVKDDVAGTTRYNPVSEAIAVSDASWWHAGTVKHVQAARHNISNLIIEIGNRFRGSVRVQGAYDTIDEAALPTIVTSDIVPTVAIPANTVTTIEVLSPDYASPPPTWAKSLAVDMGNTLASKQYTSHEESGITDRTPTWTLRIARTALGDFNPWTLRDQAVNLIVRLRLTESDGRYSELGARGQIETINEIDIDGDYGWELTGPCVASDAGGDEFFVEFGGA